MLQRNLSESIEGFLTARSSNKKTAFAALLGYLRNFAAERRTEPIVAALRALRHPHLDYTSATALLRILRPLARAGQLPGRKVRLARLVHKGRLD